MSKKPLTRTQADAIEDELRQIEADPTRTKTHLRLFMQSCMPCGHAVGNLLTCSEPPYGCVICGEPKTINEGSVPDKASGEIVACPNCREEFDSSTTFSWMLDTNGHPTIETIFCPHCGASNVDPPEWPVFPFDSFKAVS